MAKKGTRVVGDGAARGDDRGRLPIPLACLAFFIFGIVASLVGVALVSGSAVAVEGGTGGLLRLFLAPGLVAVLTLLAILLGAMVAHSATAPARRDEGLERIASVLEDFLGREQTSVGGSVGGPKGSGPSRVAEQAGETTQPTALPTARHSPVTRIAGTPQPREKSPAAQTRTFGSGPRSTRVTPGAGSRPAEDRHSPVQAYDSRAMEAAPSQQSIGAQLLIQIWDQCREEGRFHPAIVVRFLRQAGVELEVRAGSDLGLGDAVIAVNRRGDSQIHLLPSFNESPEAVAEWFHNQARSARITRIDHLIKPALLAPSGGGYQLNKRGEIA